MRTRSLVLVLLRVFAIYWVMQSLSQIMVLAPWAIAIGQLKYWGVLVAPTVVLVFALVLWYFATKFSNAIVRGHDAELSTVTLTREDLYSFAFVFLGLYYVLSAVSGIVENGYRFLTEDAVLSESDPRHGKLLFPFLGHLLTLIMGFAAILGVSKWTRLILKNDKSRD